MHRGPWRKQAGTGLGERKSTSQQPELLHQDMWWPRSGHGVTGVAPLQDSISTASPRKALLCVFCRKGGRGRPSAVQRGAQRPHGGSGWAGNRTWLYLTVGKDTRDKAGLGATGRGSHDGTTERASGGTEFLPPEREVGPGPGSDARWVPSEQPRSRASDVLCTPNKHLTP